MNGQKDYKKNKNVMLYKKKAQIVGQKILMGLIKLKFWKPL